jgi:starch-binding outer membrane protein, SusD/RagB family
LISSCRKFVEIDPPRTDLIKTTVFESDATANAAMTDVYYTLRNTSTFNGGTRSVSYFGSLLSDEQIGYNTGQTPDVTIQLNNFGENALLANNIFISQLWSSFYNCIYKTNAIIEGLSGSSGVSANLKKQLEGEAKFIVHFVIFILLICGEMFLS